jgi:hypothetical protein
VILKRVVVLRRTIEFSICLQPNPIRIYTLIARRILSFEALVDDMRLPNANLAIKHKWSKGYLLDDDLISVISP